MIRTLRTARRSLRAALAAGRHMVAAAISAHHRLIVRLAEACDTGADVRIRYTDSKGARSERGITPRRLWADSKGHILVTAHDHRDQDEANFRTDRITIDPQEPAMATRFLARHLQPGDVILVCGRTHTVYAVAQDGAEVQVYVTSDHYAPYRFPDAELVTIVTRNDRPVPGTAEVLETALTAAERAGLEVFSQVPREQRVRLIVERRGITV